MRAHIPMKVRTFWNKTAAMEEVDDVFKVALESLYAKKIKEINYDEEETYQEYVLFQKKNGVIIPSLIFAPLGSQLCHRN